MNTRRFKATKVSIEGSRLRLGWDDGHTSEYPGIWLINACDCQACGSTETAVRHRLLSEIPRHPKLLSAKIDAVGDIVIDWGSSHISCFNPKWLRSHCPSAEERGRRRENIKCWDQSIFDKLPYMDYQTVANDPARHLDFLETLLETGFVILKAVPKEKQHTEKVASLVGLLKLSNYGIFELEAKPTPEIVGDTAIPLNLHTDEAYRIDVPAITLFHVLAQTQQGGDSTLADGLHLVEVLARQDPQAFEILCTIPARFHRVLKEGRWFDNSAPIISRDSEGLVTGVRLLDRAMAPVDCALENIEAFYDAARKLLELVYSGTGMLTVKLKAGEMLVFNNQRLMHGRTGFDPSSGRRHVRSCHVDLDEFHSSLRVAYRRADNEKCWNRFGASVRN